MDDRTAAFSPGGPQIADPALQANLPPKSPVKRGSKQAKGDVSENRLQWQQVNPATWRLIDPDGPQVHLQASHGQWGGYYYPKALAYVFDAGVLGKHDWRIRVRRRGDRWQAFGCIIDADTAKRIAQQEVENPSQPKPSKFAVPLNYLGGYRWDARALDSPTRVYIRDAEIGAVKVEVTQ